MQQVLEHWRELGVTVVRTSVVPSNTGASRLYESLGFRLTGEEDHGELVMVLDCPLGTGTDSGTDVRASGHN